MLRIGLKFLGVIAVSVLAAFLSWHFGAGPGKDAAPILAFFGSLSFFFAENLEFVIWGEYGWVTETSPAAAFRILGVIFWIITAVCILFWRS